MNFNGQGIYTNHFIAKRINPSQADKLQRDMDAFRLKRIYDAANSQPVYQPLQFNMTAAAQTSPYRDTTNRLNYDVLIIGIKTDTPDRNIVIRRTESDRSVSIVGNEDSLYLTGSDIAGGTVNSGNAQQGIFYLPAPIVRPASTRLTVEMFKTDATGDVEQANIVLVGIRVSELVGISDADRVLIDKYITLREVPEPIELKQLIEFSSAAAGGLAVNKFSPTSDEPLLIRGCRTTLQFSSIEVGVQGQPTWTTEACPVWGIAAEDGNTRENYHWFSRPVYLPPQTSIEARRVINSLDGFNIDTQTGNTITWICETV